jgi:hypothetical protein
MTLLPAAGIILIWSAALTIAVGSKTTRQSGAKQAPQHDSTPKSFAPSVAGPLQHAEDDLLGVAQAMPEGQVFLHPTAENSTMYVALQSRSSM